MGKGGGDLNPKTGLAGAIRRILLAAPGLPRDPGLDRKRCGPGLRHPVRFGPPSRPPQLAPSAPLQTEGTPERRNPDGAR